MLGLIGGFLRIVLFLAIPLVLVWVYLAFFAREPVFGPEADVGLGEQTVQAIAEDPEQYPVLSREDYPEAYAHLDRITGRIVASPAVSYRDLFSYSEVRIIHDDDTLNAFCTPGGFIYVYTGLIKYLESEDHFAGVMGHEIAHAELRHSSFRLQREYGAEQLFRFILLTSPMSLGDATALAILKDLTGLRYGRDQEADADSMSVRYLADAGYACDGAAGFFAKMLANQDDVRIPELLSSHPGHANRVRDIRAEAAGIDCDTTPTPAELWLNFQASLP